MDEVNLPLATFIVQVIDESLIQNYHLQQILIVYSITLCSALFDRLKISLWHSEEVDEFLVFFIDDHILEKVMCSLGRLVPNLYRKDSNLILFWAALNTIL